MSHLTFFAGISSIFFAWGFLVIPALWLRLDYNKQPISHTGTLPKVKWFFNAGLVGAGLSQMLYVIGLWQDLAVKFLPAGVVVFVIGSVCIVLAGLITLNHSERLHTGLATAYFALAPAGALLFELTLSSTQVNYHAIGVLLAILVMLGMLYFHQVKKNMAYTAFWGIATSTLWVLHFYFFR